MKWRRLFRDEYRRQPAQLLRRAWRTLTPRPDPARLEVTLPCGLPLTIDPRESIGRAILALNVLDLPVTEALWRLTDPGETAIDAGANIGHMTAVLAVRLGEQGVVHSLEPVPELFGRLEANLRTWGQAGARVRPHAAAAAEAEGVARIQFPADFADNRGTGHLAPAGVSSAGVEVRAVRLDRLIPADGRVGVLKLDVEGAEARALRGADGLLGSHRVRDVVFEEHRPLPADSVELLRRHGYTVFRVARGPRGPRLLPAEERPAGELDPPTYLGTCDPARAVNRFLPSGWQCLARR